MIVLESKQIRLTLCKCILLPLSTKIKQILLLHTTSHWILHIYNMHIINYLCIIVIINLSFWVIKDINYFICEIVNSKIQPKAIFQD